MCHARKHILQRRAIRSQGVSVYTHLSLVMPIGAAVGQRAGGAPLALMLLASLFIRRAFRRGGAVLVLVGVLVLLMLGLLDLPGGLQCRLLCHYLLH